MKMNQASIYIIKIISYLVAIFVVAFTYAPMKRYGNDFLYVFNAVFILFGGRWIGDKLTDVMGNNFGLKYPGEIDEIKDHIPIDLENFDENGLNAAVGSKLLSLRWLEGQNPECGISHLELHWEEGGVIWEVHDHSTMAGPDLEVRSILVERKILKFHDIDNESEELNFDEFTVKACRIASVCDGNMSSDVAISLICENKNELKEVFIATMPRPGTITFWLSTEAFPKNDFISSDLKWRCADMDLMSRHKISFKGRFSMLPHTFKAQDQTGKCSPIIMLAAYAVTGALCVAMVALGLAVIYPFREYFIDSRLAQLLLVFIFAALGRWGGKKVASKLIIYFSSRSSRSN